MEREDSGNFKSESSRSSNEDRENGGERREKTRALTDDRQEASEFRREISNEKNDGFDGEHGRYGESDVEERRRRGGDVSESYWEKRRHRGGGNSEGDDRKRRTLTEREMDKNQDERQQKTDRNRSRNDDRKRDRKDNGEKEDRKHDRAQRKEEEDRDRKRGKGRNFEEGYEAQSLDRKTDGEEGRRHDSEQSEDSRERNHEKGRVADDCNEDIRRKNDSEVDRKHRSRDGYIQRNYEKIGHDKGGEDRKHGRSQYEDDPRNYEKSHLDEDEDRKYGRGNKDEDNQRNYEKKRHNVDEDRKHSRRVDKDSQKNYEKSRNDVEKEYRNHGRRSKGEDSHRNYDKRLLDEEEEDRSHLRKSKDEVNQKHSEKRRYDGEQEEDRKQGRRSREEEKYRNHEKRYSNGKEEKKNNDEEESGSRRRLKDRGKGANIHQELTATVDERKKDPPVESQQINPDANRGRSGGIYIPPFKLARMMKDIEDKSSVEYQRLTWDALRKSINGLVNKVNAANIKNIIPELFSENLIRGRGLFCRSCMKSQMASPGFTDVFAALVAVVNTKFPEVGNLLLQRIVLQLKRAYKRNDKPLLLAATKFIAHLVNQQVAHEIIALELLAILLENPTDDSVEVAVGFVTECGSALQDLSPQGLHAIFERFRGILHEGEIDKRVQFLIEGLFAIRKAKFQGYPAVRPELDLVEQEDQFTHELSLEDEFDQEITLDIFKPDPQFLEHEKAYEELKKDILGEESSSEEAGSDEESDDENDEEFEEEEERMKIQDETETNLVNLRRTIYLTIMSSVDFEEAGHKLLKIKLEPGQEMELCIMLLECCCQERTYLRYYGLLGQRFCMINKVYQDNFEKCFVDQYSMIHRLETNKLRNVAKFFAHLLGTDALPWHVLAYIRLTEDDTTSSSRIFIKILFQELSEHLGIRLLNERLSVPTMQASFESIFPRDNPKNTRFSINFFTSIGLGGLTENLREYLKNMPRFIMQQQKAVSESDDESETESSSSDSSGSSDSDSSESESEPSSDRSRGSDRLRKRRKKD